jgi:hypothetical protein
MRETMNDNEFLKIPSIKNIHFKEMKMKPSPKINYLEKNQHLELLVHYF